MSSKGKSENVVSKFHQWVTQNLLTTSAFNKKTQLIILVAGKAVSRILLLIITPFNKIKCDLENASIWLAEVLSNAFRMI